MNRSSRDQSHAASDGQGNPTLADMGLANSETGEYEFEVWQEGIPVAEVSARDLHDAFREACHYAAMYGQDGPVRIVQVQRRAIQIVADGVGRAPRPTPDADEGPGTPSENGADQ